MADYARKFITTQHYQLNMRMGRWNGAILRSTNNPKERHEFVLEGPAHNRLEIDRLVKEFTTGCDCEPND